MSSKKHQHKQTQQSEKAAASSQPQPKPATHQPSPKAASKKAFIPQDEAATLVLKEETLKWLFSLLGGIILFWILATIVQSVYHPNIEAIIKEANETSFTHDSRPEPMEILLFRVGVLSLTLGTWLFYILFSRLAFIKDLAAKPVFQSVVAICVVLAIIMIYADFTAANPFAPGGTEQPQNNRDTVAKTNFAFYFDGLFLGDYLWPYILVFVPAVACIFYLGIRLRNWETQKNYKNIVTGVSVGFLVIILFMIFRINIFEFPYTFENQYDFNAVYYSMTQVYSGSAMLVNNFTNTYGLYPHFLAPIFAVIGLNVYKFTVVISLLIITTFVCNFLFLRKFVNNQVIWFLGCCAVLFIPFFDFRLLTNFDSAFVFPPIRYIIPGTLTFLASLYLNKRSKILYALTFILAGYFILWNPEIGMVTYVAWVVFNLYHDFYTDEGKINFKQLAIHLGVAVTAVAFSFTTYKYIVYAGYGSMPDIGSLFSYIAHLGKGGNGSLPMTLVHPWNMVALVIALGFAYASTKLYQKKITAKASVVLMSSLVALGMLVYFQGRSHNWPLAIGSTYMWVVLTILGDELWTKIRNTDLKSTIQLHLLFVLFLFLISFSFIEIIFNFGKISDLMSQAEDKDKAAPEMARIAKNVDFINANSHEKEKIYILSSTPYQGLYFDGNKRRSAFNPGEQDMILNVDLNRMVQQVTDSAFNAFIEPERIGFTYLTRVFAALAACYEVKNTNQSVYELTRRKPSTPTKTFFTDNQDILLHRKYTDDTAGYRKRMDDAAGIGQLQLAAPVMSMEVLFYTDSQAFQYATLAGNINDSSGFVVASILHSNNYFFGVNGKGTAAPMPMNEWVYVVMNIYPDHMEVYRNGELATTYGLPTPMRNSPNKLCIGNLGYMRYYIGPIAEIDIRSAPIDKSRIAATWEQIKAR